MRRSSVITTIAATTALVTVTAGGAEARLDLYIDKYAQQISVVRNGALLYVWPASTRHDRFSAPEGIYAPERLERVWFSRAYYNSPMPYAIFFHNGDAIHGSYDIAEAGGPACHGCVRLHPREAALLFAMVEREGPGNTTIFVGGGAGRPPARHRNFDGPVQPPFRDDGMGPGPYPPPGPMPPPPRGRPGRYPDEAGAYPPPGPDPAPYGDGRGPPRDPRVPPAYGGDPYADGGPYGPRIPSDYNDPYGDGQGDPYGPDAAGPYPPPGFPPGRYGGGRTADPRSPWMPPHTADGPGDGPGRQRGEQTTTRGRYPADRLPPPRPDRTASAERPPRNGVRPPVTRTAGARSGRVANPPPSRQGPPRWPEPGSGPAGGDATKLPVKLPPAPPPTSASLSPPAQTPPPPAMTEAPPQPPPPDVAAYRILPPSYWAGAAWRWRLRRDDETSHGAQ